MSKLNELPQGMVESFRWYGPSDPVSLQDIRQCGCEGVITSLHHIAYGEAWSRDEIRKRIDELAAAGLTWSAVESVPVSEAIKTRTGDYQQHIANYQETIRNLGAEGIEVIIYNFMPVLDWVRTDMEYKLDDGSECLRFDPVKFAAFEIYLLKRQGAEADYTAEQLEKAKDFYESMSAEQVAVFERNTIDVFPGCKMGLSLDEVKAMLAKYDDIDRAQLKEHLKLFLQAVIPACEEAGVRMAIHPDDPPFSIMGLPRIICTEQDLVDLVEMVDSPANGLCFCSGSLSPIPDNDLPAIIQRLGHRINVLHLRSTQREPDGSFYEANHLEGSVDMYAVMKAALQEMKKRHVAGRADWRLAFRPDHGHTMLDDLSKPAADNPGYSCLGRMRGLAELRGLQLGILRSGLS
ncbi:mannonate dehydratase [Persicirhabdus sediminis]|uniref:Mannonate dehydratase n=1 Tax=Persicirhabdus sediminis TaxID=454144 RepID=A0A8J7SM11_9BACT|nr:mannonate dehydratase [Persicirhabdus sediminis]MBK1790788.1 mannonate dehydratase [Persicirhabdus sediminis]